MIEWVLKKLKWIQDIISVINDKPKEKEELIKLLKNLENILIYKKRSKNYSKNLWNMLIKTIKKWKRRIDLIFEFFD